MGQDIVQDGGIEPGTNLLGLELGRLLLSAGRGSLAGGLLGLFWVQAPVFWQKNNQKLRIYCLSQVHLEHFKCHCEAHFAEAIPP
jgi:hypothetical protein